MSSASADSQAARTSPASESISSEEPTLTTMRRKFLSCGRRAMVWLRFTVIASQRVRPVGRPDDILHEAIHLCKGLDCFVARAPRNDCDFKARSMLHYEGIELVAVGVAEIGGIELRAAVAGWAFTGGAERQRELVDAIDLLLVLGR